MEHAQCNLCFKLQRIIEDAKRPLQERRDAAACLRRHHQEQYLDRTLYWNLRFASQCYNDILVIIIDSMDKAKFAWPSWPWERRPHDLADLLRPRMDFTAVLAHGYTAGLFMSAETTTHGSDFCLEALSRTIEKVYQICKSTGRPFPRHLVIQSDNTVAQAKNQFVCIFLAYLVLKGYFLTANLFFLRVGHTHEDIDQFFALLVVLILRCHHYQAPQELLSFLLKELKPRFAAKQEDVFGEVVTGVRDYKQWLEPLNRTMWNAFSNRQGHEAPHSFTFKKGRDLRREEALLLKAGESLDPVFFNKLQHYFFFAQG